MTDKLTTDGIEAAAFRIIISIRASTLREVLAIVRTAPTAAERAIAALLDETERIIEEASK